jgi:hypothetical protein
MANSPPLMNSFFSAFGLFHGEDTLAAAERQVLLLSNAVTNSCAWAAAFGRVRHEAIGGVTDERAQTILQEVLAYPGVPASLRSLDATLPTTPVVSIQYARDTTRSHAQALARSALKH